MTAERNRRAFHLPQASHSTNVRRVGYTASSVAEVVGGVEIANNHIASGVGTMIAGVIGYGLTYILARLADRTTQIRLQGQALDQTAIQHLNTLRNQNRPNL